MSIQGKPKLTIKGLIKDKDNYLTLKELSDKYGYKQVDIKRAIAMVGIIAKKKPRVKKQKQEDVVEKSPVVVEEIKSLTTVEEPVVTTNVIKNIFGTSRTRSLVD